MAAPNRPAPRHDRHKKRVGVTKGDTTLYIKGRVPFILVTGRPGAAVHEPLRTSSAAIHLGHERGACGSKQTALASLLTSPPRRSRSRTHFFRFHLEDYGMFGI